VVVLALISEPVVVRKILLHLYARLPAGRGAAALRRECLHPGAGQRATLRGPASWVARARLALAKSMLAPNRHPLGSLVPGPSVLDELRPVP
jgi:hypothetical protein